MNGSYLSFFGCPYTRIYSLAIGRDLVNSEKGFGRRLTALSTGRATLSPKKRQLGVGLSTRGAAD